MTEEPLDTQIMVTIVPDVDDLDVVFCPVCKSPDPFDIGDYQYQCQGCGAQFMVLSGPLETEEPAETDTGFRDPSASLMRQYEEREQYYKRAEREIRKS